MTLMITSHANLNRNGLLTWWRRPALSQHVTKRPVSCVFSIPPPQQWTEVASWARNEFATEAKKPDEMIDLSRACLLIALEDESSIEMHPELLSALSDQPMQFRTLASASTWNGSRLDCLAEEVKADLASCGDGPEGMIPDSPMAVVNALNRVLFDRQGYVANRRYGAPTDARWSSVLEYGVGNSAILSALYLVISRKVGLPMSARALEGGRYWVLWPQDEAKQINSDGQRFVVDPYGQGGLILADECAELFEVQPFLLTGSGASTKELISSCLVDLMLIWWSRAIGCSPSPASMTPLSLATALKDRGNGLVKSYHALDRATSAAEKRLQLTPGDEEATIQYAVLRYLHGSRLGIDDAYLELGCLLEAKLREGDMNLTRDQEARTLFERIRMRIEFSSLG